MELPDEGSFAYQLYKSETFNSEFGIAHFVTEIIDCLESVNQELNGENPPENPAPWRPVDRVLSLAVSSIIDDGWRYYLLWKAKNRFSECFLNQLALALWAISCAWVLILHGDIDSLRKYVLYEYIALGLSPLDDWLMSELQADRPLG
jgi:hypothetical protein